MELTSFKIESHQIRNNHAPLIEELKNCVTSDFMIQLFFFEKDFMIQLV